MTGQLIKLLPPFEEAKDLPPEQLASFLLKHLIENEQSEFSKHNILGTSAIDLSLEDYVPDNNKRETVKKILAEAMHWLDQEGMIAPEPSNLNSDWFFVTRKGKRIYEESDLSSYLKGNLLPPDRLEGILIQKVRPLFLQGDYETAIFRAFKLLEVRIREAAGLDKGDLGVDLAREAFHPEDGQLTDENQEGGEKEALSHLMAGAIGWFKNPPSHREVSWDPHEAAEVIMFANHLLRIVQSRSEDN